MDFTRLRHCNKKTLCWSNNSKITASFHKWVQSLLNRLSTFDIFRVKTSSSQCEVVKDIFFQDNKNLTGLRKNIESHRVTILLPSRVTINWDKAFWVILRSVNVNVNFLQDILDQFWRKKTVSRGHMGRAHGTFYETCAKVGSCAPHRHSLCKII